MQNIQTLIADLEEPIHFSEFGANIGGAPCGAVFVIVAIYSAT